MNTKIILYALIALLTPGLMGATSRAAMEPISEARVAIYEIHEMGARLSGELSEFHGALYGEMRRIIELEAMERVLKREGDAGGNCSDFPEKFARIHAEYAKRISALKDIFIKQYPLIQTSMSDFTGSLHRGKACMAEFRSDCLAMAGDEPGWSRRAFEELRRGLGGLRAECPRDAEYMSEACKGRWERYVRRLDHLKQHVNRVRIMKKMAGLMDSISGELTEIVDRYGAGEVDAVDWLTGFALHFEQCIRPMQGGDPPGMTKVVRELKEMEGKIGIFEKFHEDVGARLVGVEALIEGHQER